MTENADLTPPTSGTGRKARKPRDPSAPKKARGPRKDYGFAATSTIRVVPEKEAKFRGTRKGYFDSVVEFNGRTVADWVDANKGEGRDPPRGWLRFFVQEGYVTLEKAA